jgi:hypothetical protein
MLATGTPFCYLFVLLRRVHWGEIGTILEKTGSTIPR